MKRLSIILLLISSAFGQIFSGSPSSGVTVSGGGIKASSNNAAPTPPTIATITCPNGTTGVLYAGCTFTATGGTTPYVWSKTGTQPTGLTLMQVGNNYELGGTPTVADTFTFTVKVTGADALFSTAAEMVTIAAGTAPLTITTALPPGGTQGILYGTTGNQLDLLNCDLIPNPTRNTNHQGGTSTSSYDWLDQDGHKYWHEKSPSGWPGDIELYDANFIYDWITENPAAASDPKAWKRAVIPRPLWPRYVTPGVPVTMENIGIYNVGQPTLNCELDGLAQTSIGDTKGTVEGPSVIDWGGTIGAQPTYILGRYYSGSAHVYQNRELRWCSVGFGRLQWQAQHLSGGVYVTDQTNTATGSVAGGAPTPPWSCGIAYPWWVGGAIPTAGQNAAGTVTTGYTLGALGGVPPYTWSNTGTMPTGVVTLSNSDSSGTLAGTPTVPGAYTPTVTVTDSASTVKTQLTSIVIATPPPPVVVSPNPPNGTAGSPYSFQFLAQQGKLPYQFAKESGTLPAGTTLNLNSGFLTASVAGAAGTYNFCIQVKGSDGSAAAAGTYCYTVVLSSPSAGGDDRYCPTDDNWTGGTVDGVAHAPTHCMNTARASTPATVATKTVCVSGCDYATLSLAITAINNISGPTIACGTTFTVASGGGTVRKIYSETFPTITRVCDSTHWIVIESDQIASLPEGTRTNPSHALYGQIPNRPAYTVTNTALLPKLILATAGTNTTVLSVTGSFIRFIGFEVTTQTGDTSLGNGMISSTGSHVIWEKMLVHPENTTNGKRTGKNCLATIGGIANTPIPCTAERGFVTSGAYNAVIDSYVYDIARLGDNLFSVAADTTGLWAGNAPIGPVKWVNNFVESGDEGLFEGGGACTSVGEDFEIRRNSVWKPLFWKRDCTAATCGVDYDTTWLVTAGTTTVHGPSIKNLLELKNADRAWIEGNVLQHNWVGQADQDGSAMLLTPKNPAQTCNAAQDSNVVVRYNKINGANKGFQVAPVLSTQLPAGIPAAEFSINIHDNLVDDITWPKWSSNGNGPCCFDAIAVKILSDLTPGSLFHDVQIQHNTFIQNYIPATGIGAPTGAFWIVTGDITGQQWPNWTGSDNIATGGFQGIGSGSGGQCVVNTGASYLTLGEAATPGCFSFTPTNTGWCADGNILMSNQWTTTNGLRSNLPLPNPTGSLASHPSPNCPNMLVGNNSVTDYTQVGFTSFSVANIGTGLNDYHLALTSPFKGKGTLGSDPGADIDMINSHIAGVE